MLPLRGTGCLFRQVALSSFTNQCAAWKFPFFLCTRLDKSHSKGIFLCFLVPSPYQVALWLAKKMPPLRGRGCLFRQVALSSFTNQCAPWKSPFFLCTRLVKSHCKGIFLCFLVPSPCQVAFWLAMKMLPLRGTGCLLRQVALSLFTNRCSP